MINDRSSFPPFDPDRFLCPDYFEGLVEPRPEDDSMKQHQQVLLAPSVSIATSSSSPSLYASSENTDGSLPKKPRSVSYEQSTSGTSTRVDALSEIFRADHTSMASTSAIQPQCFPFHLSNLFFLPRVPTNEIQKAPVYSQVEFPAACSKSVYSQFSSSSRPVGLPSRHTTSVVPRERNSIQRRRGNSDGPSFAKFFMQLNALAKILSKELPEHPMEGLSDDQWKSLKASPLITNIEISSKPILDKAIAKERQFYTIVITLSPLYDTFQYRQFTHKPFAFNNRSLSKYWTDTKPWMIISNRFYSDSTTLRTIVISKRLALFINKHYSTTEDRRVFLASFIVKVKDKIYLNIGTFEKLPKNAVFKEAIKQVLSDLPS